MKVVYTGRDHNMDDSELLEGEASVAEQSPAKSVLDLILEWLRNTSVRAVPKAMNASSPCSRTLWGLVAVSLILCALTLSALLIRSFMSYPYNTVTKERCFAPDSPDTAKILKTMDLYPALTICDLNSRPSLADTVELHLTPSAQQRQHGQTPQEAESPMIDCKLILSSFDDVYNCTGRIQML